MEGKRWWLIGVIRIRWISWVGRITRVRGICWICWICLTDQGQSNGIGRVAQGGRHEGKLSAGCAGEGAIHPGSGCEDRVWAIGHIAGALIRQHLHSAPGEGGRASGRNPVTLPGCINLNLIR
jgi:hypothetical protein